MITNKIFRICLLGLAVTAVTATAQTPPTGIRPVDLERLKAYAEAAGDKPYIVRMTWVDLDHWLSLWFNRLRRIYIQAPSSDSLSLFLRSGRHGQAPLILPGESVVFHNLPNHRSTVLGKYNPGLVNSNVGMMLTNKYVEARFFEKYAPGYMAKTRLLSDFTGEKASAAEVKARLDREFPGGWIIKGTYDNATDRKNLISDKIDLAGEIEKFRASGFTEKMMAARDQLATIDPDAFIRKIRKMEGYIGWRIHKLLKNPDLSIVQSKLDIQKEYRVEAVMGRVLGDQSTFPRYGLELHALRRLFREDSPEQAEQVRGAEEFVAGLLERLPENLRSLPFGFDVALLKDGKFAIVESNPLGNSGLLMIVRDSSRALDRFLAQVPQLDREGKLNWGLSDAEQMKYVREFLRELDIDPAVQFPFYEFSETEIRDKAQKPVGPCEKALAP